MLDVVQNNTIIASTLVIFLGLLLGSFATAIIYRTRHGESWIWNNKRDDKARSYCPSCNHTLHTLDLIPVFSYLLQKGHCRHCKTKIPTGYLFIEITVLFISFLIFLILGFTTKGLLAIALTPFFVSQVVLALKYNMLSKLLLSILIVGGMGIIFL